MPENQASSWGRLGAHISWGATKDRSARTAPGRAAMEQKFLDQAEGDVVRAAHIRKAYYQRLAQKSAAVRRAKKQDQSGPAPQLRSSHGGTRPLDPTGEKAVRNVMRGGSS